MTYVEVEVEELVEVEDDVEVELEVLDDEEVEVEVEVVLDEEVELDDDVLVEVVPVMQSSPNASFPERSRSSLSQF